MFNGITEFFQFNPAAMIGGIAGFVVLAAIGFLIYRQKKKKKPVKNNELIDINEETIGLPQETMPRETGIKPGITVSTPIPEPLIKDSAPKPPDVTNNKGEIREKIKVGPEYKYRAVIRWFPRPGRTPIIEFGNKIEKPLGGLYFLEPSCPETGDHYYIKQNEDGTFSPYDPRAAAILSKNTPYAAYDAVHWDEAEGVWIMAKGNWMEKISGALVFVVGFAAFIVVIVSIGS